MEDRRKYQQERKEDFATLFMKNNEIPKYMGYQAVSKFRSIRRAIRRGKMDLYTGIIFPKRPFNNRSTTIGRNHNELKKRVYEQYMQRVVQ